MDGLIALPTLVWHLVWMLSIFFMLAPPMLVIAFFRPATTHAAMGLWLRDRVRAACAKQ
jgi:hypothetical protein